jgi:two-component system NtrC family sensor kinase
VKTMKQELEDSARTLEERVQARTKELMAIQMQMAQSEKLASLGRMSSGVAHEINNPLGGILTFAMLALEDARPDDPVRKNLEIIVKQTLRCRDIVKGLLEFSRKPEAVAATADVHSVVQSTMSLLEQQAIFHNIHTVRDLEVGLPPAHVDPGQLQQVVMNLVLNALDAMEGSGVLTISTEALRDGKEIAINVIDTGKGIPPDIQPLVFEPFFTTKEVGQGTGLGLAIVHGIITRAGGSIELDSSEKGTRFRIRLPSADIRPPPSSAGIPGLHHSSSRA